MQVEIDKEETEETINKLQAFIKRVKAQRGKSISEEDADMLIQYATNLINSLWCISAVSHSTLPNVTYDKFQLKVTVDSGKKGKVLSTPDAPQYLVVKSYQNISRI